MRNQRYKLGGVILAVLAACFLTVGGLCSSAEASSNALLPMSVQTADNKPAGDPTAETPTIEVNGSEEENESTGGVAIPREIVLGIFGAAAIGGAVGGYYFTRKRK